METTQTNFNAIKAMVPFLKKAFRKKLKMEIREKSRYQFIADWSRMEVRLQGSYREVENDTVYQFREAFKEGDTVVTQVSQIVTQEIKTTGKLEICSISFYESNLVIDLQAVTVESDGQRKTHKFSKDLAD